MITTLSPRHRILGVVRMHAVSWQLIIAWPVGIVAASFIVGYGIFFAVGDTVFPFALGLSVTRRDFFAATTVVAVIQAVAFGVGLFTLGAIERATDGWGVQMRMFDVPRYFTDNPVLQLFSLILSILLLASIGLFIGSIYQRWRMFGLFVTGIATLLGFGTAAVVVTWQRWWPDLGNWFADIPRTMPLAVIPAALAATALATTWAVLRRATP